MKLGPVTKLDKKSKSTSKNLTLRHQKVYFLKLHMGVNLRAKFEVCSMILTSFKHWGQGVLPTPPPPPPQLKTNP